MQSAPDIGLLIRRFIRDEIAPDCDEAKLDNNHSLLESGILDSFGIMSLLAFIGEELQVAVPPDEIEPANFETIAAISQLVAKHR